LTAPQVGIMQGRLTPPIGERIQAFPAARWREEFSNAAAAGLACIEWIYELPEEARNPLKTDQGIAEMRRLAEVTGVSVRSICADYYMTEQLLCADGSPHAAHVAHLEWLIARAGRLGAAYIVLPFVDSSALRTPQRIAGAVGLLRRLAPQARAAGVELHVECDLAPPSFRALLDGVGDAAVKANYDIGNSASLGFSPHDELPAIAAHLGSVHVKDRKRGGTTRPLGSGDADLPAAFRMLRAAGFGRWFILQAARGEDGGEVTLAAANRALVERMWAAAAA